MIAAPSRPFGSAGTPSPRPRRLRPHWQRASRSRALIDARKRDIDVQVLVDGKGNRSSSSTVAIGLTVGAGIPTRTVSAYAIYHEKFIVAAPGPPKRVRSTTPQAAARSNSENVLVVWNDPQVAATYLAHWQSRWAQGVTALQ